MMSRNPKHGTVYSYNEGCRCEPCREARRDDSRKRRKPGPRSRAKEPWLLPGESWRPVVGYEGAYEVSSLGRVRSVTRTVPTLASPLGKHIEGLVMRQRTDWDGYRRIGLTDARGQVEHMVHHLVLEAFVAPRPNALLTRHLNAFRSDNRPENLAWGTPAENSEDMVLQGNSFSANKERCPRGHPLTGANIRDRGVKSKHTGKKYRECLACHRAGALCRYYGKTLDVNLADDYYERITGEKYDRAGADSASLLPLAA